MKAVITVTGRDTVGIIAGVSGVCAEYGVNICDITQSVIGEYFAMIMLAEIEGLTIKFADFVDKLAALGEERGLVIHTMHEDIFNSMHRI
ncbi:MAG: ACT domain-containing protein [Clostridia bacterium]|nr:ACT domain-containing protein [Clostridia bacterium]MBQ8859678.1 ACT domain-containing protein [Clostridia bacterium]